jgi:hypothetical protein
LDIINKIFDLIENRYYKILSKIIDFLNPKSIKRIFFALVCFAVFFIFQKQIIYFIEEYILVKKDFSNFYLDWVFRIAFIITIIFLLIKLVRDKYLPSYNEFFISISILLVIIFYEKKWNLLELDFYFFKLEYIFLIIIPLIIFIEFPIVIKLLNPYIKEKRKENNYFFNDDPILRIENDALNSLKTVENLYRILKNEQHEKSFSIGLVGPWGNGKSSIINLVKKRLIDEQNDLRLKKNSIIIHFLPYLNHKDDDIIKEFFITLSDELSKYNGNISNVLIQYSERLTNLYKDKNIFNFLENHVTKFDSVPASEMFNEINERLKEIDKKIIVFIDDLDRLNEKEILQVLKLIRNTANFKNTFFVVAMDKEYVLNRLKGSNDILNSNFIDKFFQLEIYLPEIDNSVLREYFIKCLLSSTLNNTLDGSFEVELKNTLNNPNLLFNDYIKNIRDVKRIVNQIIYDYPIFKRDIDFKDFINFIFFKLKFPKFMKILADGKADFIEIDRDKNTYNLIEKKDDTKEKKLIRAINKSKLNSNSFLEKYELFHSSEKDSCRDTDSSINCEDRILLIKTLAYLFGKENEVKDSNSIKDENNFRNLMKQEIPSSYFSTSNFEILYYNNDSYKAFIEEYHEENKLQQLINRLKFFNTNDNFKIKRTIQILIYLYENVVNYNLFETDILFLLGVFVERKFKYYEERYESNIDLVDWIKEHIFENNELKVKTRLTLFGHLWNSRHENKNWYLEQNYINKEVLSLYENYLYQFYKRLWDVNDYNTYKVYHSIKEIDDLWNEINKVLINFWKSNNIEMLCAQTTEIDTWSSSSFKISNVVNEIFGSTKQFIDFIKNHKQSDSIEIKEFLKLYELLEISDFKYTSIYSFEKSQLMKNKIERQKQFRTKDDENKNTIQLILETNSITLIDSLRKHSELKSKYSIRIESKEKENFTLHYIFVFLKKSLSTDPVLTFTQDLYHSILPSLNDWEKSNFVSNNIKNGINFIPQQNNDNYIKVISIEPKDKNQFNYEIY